MCIVVIIHTFGAIRVEACCTCSVIVGCDLSIMFTFSLQLQTANPRTPREAPACCIGEDIGRVVDREGG